MGESFEKTDCNFFVCVNSGGAVRVARGRPFCPSGYAIRGAARVLRNVASRV